MPLDRDMDVRLCAPNSCCPSCDAIRRRRAAREAREAVSFPPLTLIEEEEEEEGAPTLVSVEPQPYERYCRRCYTWHMNNIECGICQRCGNTHPYDSVWYQYCPGCCSCHAGDRCVWCEECDDYHGAPLCDPPIPQIIHNYGYRPDPMFRGVDPHRLFLGMELEVEISEDSNLDVVAERVQESVGDLAYLKEDGSIDNGFEIVTHPMTYPYFMERFPWDDLFGTLRDNGASSPNSTGIHVHASRAGFSGQSHTYKWLKLLYRNSEKVQRMARRRDSHWAAFRPEDRIMSKYYAKGWPVSPRNLSLRDEAEAAARLGTQYFGPARYSAVNVATGRGTYEVRVFRSTVHARRAQAAIGLVHSSIEYARQLTAADVCKRNGWAWPQFTQWVGDHSEYAPLYREMEDRQCVS